MRSATPKKNPDGTIQTPTSPTIANLAFACELYIKSLLKSAGETVSGHELEKLFSKLPDAKRDGIRIHYKEITGQKDDDLDSDIAGFSKAFVEWRYLYEQVEKPISLGKLFSFTRSLLKFVLSEHADWSVNQANINDVDQSPPEAVIYMLYLGEGKLLQARIK